MPIFAEYKESTGFSLAPAGQFQAVCCEVLDHGHSIKEYKAPDGTVNSRPVREVQFVFQLNKLDDDTGRRFEVRSKKLNALTLGEKSSLREFLKQWRGHDLTEAEKRPPGLDLEGLVGRNAIISVIHVEGRQEGSKWANIGSIIPLMDGMPAIEAEGYESKQAAVDAQKAAASAAASNGGDAFSGPPPSAGGKKDDIPF